MCSCTAPSWDNRSPTDTHSPQKQQELFRPIVCLNMSLRFLISCNWFAKAYQSETHQTDGCGILMWKALCISLSDLIVSFDFCIKSMIVHLCSKHSIKTCCSHVLDRTKEALWGILNQALRIKLSINLDCLLHVYVPVVVWGGLIQLVCLVCTWFSCNAEPYFSGITELVVYMRMIRFIPLMSKALLSRQTS